MIGCSLSLRLGKRRALQIQECRAATRKFYTGQCLIMICGSPVWQPDTSPLASEYFKGQCLTGFIAVISDSAWHVAEAEWMYLRGNSRCTAACLFPAYVLPPLHLWVRLL